MLAAGAASATPRYAARYQQNCNLCHTNPTGGGKRTGYASQVLVPSEMTLAKLPDDATAKLDPQVSPALSVGADLRTVYLYSPEKAFRQNFFQMQGTVYVAFEVDRYALYFAQGQSQTRELFGLGYVLPENGYVKVGRFAPAYGWKFDDHTLFVRERLGFAPPAQTDVGVEIGMYPGDAGFQFTLTNGAMGSIQDNDHLLVGTGRGDVRARFLGASLTAGGSFAYGESNAGVRRMFGPFGSLHAGRLTWIGEADVLFAPGVGGIDALVTSHEIVVDLRQGLALRATYDFYDPNLDAKSGALVRYGLGLDALLNPLLGVQAMASWREADAGPAVSEAEEYFQPIVMVHVLF